MQVIRTTKFRRCRDGSIVNEFCLDESVTEPFLEFLRNFGTVKIIAHLDPPFYSFTMPNYFIVKGMVYDASLHVRFFSHQHEEGLTRFEALLSQYTQAISGISRIDEDQHFIQNPHSYSE